MMRRRFTFAGLASMIAMGAIVIAAATPDGPFPHERKEVAGLAIVFGAEPEPALTGEMQFLRWRVSVLPDRADAYTEMRGAEVKITHDGTEYGPFLLRPQRGDPGLYQTRHIFTAAGEYETLLTFRKGDVEETHSVDFNFNINPRSDVEIPPRRGRGG